MNYVRVESVSIKDHPELDEDWVQEYIAKDPKALGLGELELRDKERRQPHAGRLDLLFEQPQSEKRYEVEIQLGETDPSHIIRTIEYWAVERKRYPQYEHCAVIVAERITGRFLNVINLFNGAIPLVAIQMTAIKMPDGIGLTFAKVIDEQVRGPVDEDEEVNEVTDRAYWEKQGAKPILGIADEILSMVKLFDPSCELRYRKYYIGILQGGVINDFVWWPARKSGVQVCFSIPEEEHITAELEEAGVNLVDYRRGAYRLRLKPEDLKVHAELIGKLLRKAHGTS